MKTATLFFVTAISAVFLTSCNKDYLQESDLFISDGYITVNISGESIDGYVLNDSFTATQVPASDMGRGAGYYKVGETYHFYITRAESYLDNPNQIELTFTKTGDLIHNVYLELDYQKMVDGNKVLYLSMYPTITVGQVTDLEFDEATGLLKGSYSVTSEYWGNATRLLTVAGDFEVTVRGQASK